MRPFPLQTFSKALRRDRRGSVSMIAVGALGVCMACAALTIDMGSWVRTHTSLQAAADATGLATALAPLTQQATAIQVLGSNGYAASALQTLVGGTYCPDNSLPPGSRFTPGIVAGCAAATGPLPNAVQVSVMASAPMSFSTFFNGQHTMAAHAVSTAAVINVAGIQVGSGVAQLNNGLLNATLSSLLGQNVALSLVSYNGLVVTNIGAISFLNALATQTGTSGTYGTLLNTTVTLQSVLNAEAAALISQGGTVAVSAAAGLQNLATQVGTSATVNLSKLIGSTAWGNDTIGAVPASALQSTLSAADLLNAALQLASTGSVLPTSAVSIPAVGSLVLMASAVEPPQGAYFGFGPSASTTVHTAQIRLLFQLTLLNSLTLGSNTGLVTIPLYVEIGSGTATISGVSCSANPATDALVSVRASTGLASVYIGNVSTTAMQNFSQSAASSITPATLVNIPYLLQITGSASATVGSSGTQNLTFNQSQMQSGQTQTVTSTQFTSGLFTSLLSNLHLQVSVLGLPGLAFSSIASTQLQSVLNGISLDPVIDPILQMVGVQLGYMTVAATGVRCGIPVLVQ